MAESFWQDTDLPASENFDAAALSLGFAFIPQVAGDVTHIRFRAHSVLSGGTYTGEFRQVTADDPPGGGTLLGQATFGSITAGDWNTVSLPAPVAVTAGVLYKAVLFTSVGRYLSKAGFFVAAAVTRGNLTGVRDNVASGGFTVRNGSYRYGAGVPYPFEGGGGAYLVDVVFEPSAVLPAQGTLDTGINLAGALTGARASAGALAGALGVAPALTSSAPHRGTFVGNLGLAPALAGARVSAGALGGAIAFTPALAGARRSVGTLTGALNLAPGLIAVRTSLGTLNAVLTISPALTGSDGQAGRAVRSFPFPPGPVSGFPWPPRPVKSFQEVAE